MKDNLTFTKIEEILQSKKPDINTVNWFFELADMKRFMHELGDPQEKPNIVHVAGTSGKTSTSYYLAELLKTGHKSVGLTVSPHVSGINERVQINGDPLNKTEFIALFQEFIALPQVKAMDITYFGLMVAFAYWVFAKKALDYAVIEVGMGGRLDATNVVASQNKICVITDIGLDHTQFLGTTLTEIATEKAGIIQQGNHVFVAEQSKPVMEVFKQACSKKSAKLHIMPNDYIDQAPKDLPLFQRRNWSLARFAFDFVSSRDVIKELSKDRLLQTAQKQVPARMQTFRLRSGKTLIIDVSHNAQKIQTLCASIKEKYPAKNIAVLISMVEGKDTSLPNSLAALREISDEIIITQFDGSQDIIRPAIKSETIKLAADQAGYINAITINKPEEAFRALLQAKTDVLLVTGSFFLINNLLPIAQKLLIVESS